MGPHVPETGHEEYDLTMIANVHAEACVLLNVPQSVCSLAGKCSWLTTVVVVHIAVKTNLLSSP